MGVIKSNKPASFNFFNENCINDKYNLLSPVACTSSYGGLPITASKSSISNIFLTSNFNVSPEYALKT